MLNRLMIVSVALVLSLAAHAADVIVVTVEDIGKPVEIIDGTCVYSEAKGFSFKKDPIEGAMEVAYTLMVERAMEAGADAVIGVDVDFANRTQKDEGRVIMCGTMVRIIGD